MLMDNEMYKFKKIIIIVSIIIIYFMCLFPPVIKKRSYPYPMSGTYYRLQYEFLLNSDYNSDYNSSKVDLTRLLLQVAVIGMTALGIIYITNEIIANKKKNLTKRNS